MILFRFIWSEKIELFGMTNDRYPSHILNCTISHTADMENDILYSFESTSTDMIQYLMKDAIEECERITRLRQRDMHTYEDDDIYDEIKNWMKQATEELTRRNTVAYTKHKETYVGFPPKTTSTDNSTRRDKDDDLEGFTLPPSLPVEKKNSLPTIDEYNSMPHSDKIRWNCISCNKPALEGSAIPGSFCSSACALQKYS